MKSPLFMLFSTTLYQNTRMKSGETACIKVALM